MTDIITATGLCPECDASVPVGADVHPSEILECPECLLELEVLSIDPLSLGNAPEVEEDWGE